VEIHRESFLLLSRASDKKGGIRLVRYIGVDLHKNNFVVCFLNQDESFRLETFPLSKAGISRFTSELSKDDAVAVEVTLDASITFTTKSKLTLVVLFW